MEQIVEFLFVAVISIAFGFAIWPRVKTSFASVEFYSKYESSVNDSAMARRIMIEDLNRAQRSVYIVTCSGREDYWDRGVVDKIRGLAGEGVEFTFILTRPMFFSKEVNNTSLRLLFRDEESHSKITAFVVEERPPVDMRLIDGRDTYITLHGEDTPGERKYVRTWGHNYPKMVESVANDILEILRTSQPLNLQN